MRLSTLGQPLALLLLVLFLAVPAQAQYALSPIPNGFFDISAQTGNNLGTAIPAAEVDEGLSPALTFSTVAPGFTFSFYGTAKTGFKVVVERPAHVQHGADGFVRERTLRPSLRRPRRTTTSPRSGTTSTTTTTVRT